MFGGVTPRKTVQVEVFFVLWLQWLKAIKEASVTSSDSEQLWLFSFAYYLLYETTYKKNWRLSWREPTKMWADPQRVPKNKRWVKYNKDNLKALALENVALFDTPKLLVGRKVNRGSKQPLAIQWDDTGFCPDNNVYCVLPAIEVTKYSEKYQSPSAFPEGWLSLTYEEKCFWLLGICTSKIANCISLIGRKNHEITVAELCRLPLPMKIDPRIIDTTYRIIELEKRRDSLSKEQINKLRQILDSLVQESYGNPTFIEITRVGKSPELGAWEKEQKKRTLTVIGQVLDFSQDKEQVLLRLSGLLDDNEEAWLPLPQELPGWALDGTVFRAELSEDIETFQELAQRPWALRKFRHTPYPYLSNEELQTKLGRMISLEDH